MATESLSVQPTFFFLPDNPVRHQQLRQKLREYELRLTHEHSTFPNQPVQSLPTFYSIRILESLLQNGFVDFGKVYRQVANEVGRTSFRRDFFENAFDVIADYALTGGKNNTRRLYPITIR